MIKKNIFFFYFLKNLIFFQIISEYFFKKKIFNLILQKKLYFLIKEVLCEDASLINVNERPFLSQQSSYEIGFCFLSRINTFFDEGSLIYINDINSYLNIYNSVINNCSSSGNGGAIYVFTSTKNTNVIFSKICVNECGIVGSSYMGLFCFIAISSEKYFNMDFSSVIYSKDYSSNSVHSLSFAFGRFEIFTSNLTKNFATHMTVFGFYQVKSNFFQYCSISDNTVEEEDIINIDLVSNNSTFSYLNVIGNKIIADRALIHLRNYQSSFLNSFYTGNIGNLFLADSSSEFIIANSIFNHLGFSAYGDGYISLSNNTYTTNFDFVLPKYTYFSTYVCEAEIPITPNQTPENTIINTFHQTLNQTPLITIDLTIQQSLNPTISNSLIRTFIETFNPTSSNTLEYTFFPTICQTISETIIPSISITFDQTVFQSISNTLKNSINPTISDTFINTLLPTISNSLLNTANPTISCTIENTLNPTISNSLINTLNPSISNTLENTLNPTISNSLINTLNPTISNTLENTLNPTISNTLENTLNPTISNSLINTLNQTILISINQNNLSINHFLYGISSIFLIILIILLFKLIFKFEEISIDESSNIINNYKLNSNLLWNSNL